MKKELVKLNYVKVDVKSNQVKPPTNILKINVAKPGPGSNPKK